MVSTIGNISYLFCLVPQILFHRVHFKGWQCKFEVGAQIFVDIYVWSGGHSNCWKPKQKNIPILPISSLTCASKKVTGPSNSANILKTSIFRTLKNDKKTIHANQKGPPAEGPNYDRTGLKGNQGCHKISMVLKFHDNSRIFQWLFSDFRGCFEHSGNAVYWHQFEKKRMVSHTKR